MKKCKGCGVILQDQDIKKIGYVKDLAQDYCMRCFRLSHYGDLSHFNTGSLKNEDIIHLYDSFKEALFVVIIDIFEFLCLEKDDFLSFFGKRPIVLIINKTDLLPENVNENKIERTVKKVIDHLNRENMIRTVFLTNRYEDQFNKQFIEYLSSQDNETILFAGRANAGKSSLLNKLLGQKDLTTSIYPGTTLNTIEIRYDRYIFIDTPGIMDPENIMTYLQTDLCKLVQIDKMIKPQIFQLSQPQSYFYDGLLRIDLFPDDKTSLIFYVGNRIDIHRSRYDKADEYQAKHNKEFKIKNLKWNRKTYEINNKQLFIIKGLGMFMISGSCKAGISYPENCKLYLSEVDF